jgi:hypothetical protein
VAVYIVPTFGVGWQSFTNGGLVNASGTIDTFQAGTTTVTSVYTTSAGTTAHANPIVLDSTGRIPAGGEVWSLGGVAMKFVLKDSVSSAIQTIDNIYGINDPTSIGNLGPSGATVSSAINMNAAAINEAQGANIAIAGSVNLTTATGNYLSFTGTGTVTSITLSPAGVYREAVITNTAAFTNNTNLLMLGAGSITLAPGDVVGFRGEASGVVRNVLLQGSRAFQGFGNQTANTVLAGPASGAAAQATFRALVPADLSMTPISSALVADIALNNAANYFDGPSVTQGTVGTWLVMGSITVSVATASNIFTKLWDGTTVIASGAPLGIANQYNSSSLSGYISAPAGPLRISAKSSATDAVIKFNQTGNSKDSFIVAIRIA